MHLHHFSLIEINVSLQEKECLLLSSVLQIDIPAVATSSQAPRGSGSDVNAVFAIE